MKLFDTVQVDRHFSSHNPFADDIYSTLSWKMTWARSIQGHGMTSGYPASEVLRVYCSGERNSPLSHERFAELIPGVTRVFRYEMDNGGVETVYANDEIVFQLESRWSVAKRVTLSLQATGSPELVKKLKDFHKENILPKKEEKNLVKTLMKGHGGLEISTLGVAGKALERDNYAKAVLHEFDHVVADLNAADPCGKLVILDGEPGTGKTYLIRALIEAVRAEFVFVPPNIVSSLAGPEIITVLANERAFDDTRPFVLIVEDADQCLMERATDNLGSISSLLNMTDGIVGAALDVRIVASTNMDIKKMPQDAALLRDGRLCRRIPVDELPEEHAGEIARRLGCFDLWSEKKPRTLAAIYRCAYNTGAKIDRSSEELPKAPTKRPAGFGR